MNSEIAIVPVMFTWSSLAHNRDRWDPGTGTGTCTDHSLVHQGHLIGPSARPIVVRLCGAICSGQYDGARCQHDGANGQLSNIIGIFNDASTGT
jgi:hypothetical protein